VLNSHRRSRWFEPSIAHSNNTWVSVAPDLPVFSETRLPLILGDSVSIHPQITTSDGAEQRCRKLDAYDTFT
jgi:hypothetical protein